MFTSYAQNFEDVLLWRALKHVGNGSYIDIGAQDPLIDSVSLAFYERGWRGVHVEPTPGYAAKLRDARPDEDVLELAIGGGPGPTLFFEFADTGLSTGKEDVARDHVGAGFSATEMSVPTLPLALLFARYADREIHWLKIDVEGMEAEVIASWGDSPARPWVLCIESTAPRSQELEHAAWEPAILERGYVFVHFDGLNRFYVHNDHQDLVASFASGPNVFDDFAVAPTSAYAGQLTQQLAERSALLAERDGQFAVASAEVARLHQHIAATDAAYAEERTVLGETAAALRQSVQQKDAEIGRLHHHIAALEASHAEGRIGFSARVAALEQLNAEKAAALAEEEAGRAQLQDELEAARQEVAALRTSTVWRATAPVRSTVNGARRIVGLPKAGVRGAMERGLLWLRQRPRAARFALRAADLVPPLKRRLLAFAEARRQGIVATATWSLEADPESVQAWRKLLAGKG